jgi:hypothetical protein
MTCWEEPVGTGLFDEGAEATIVREATVVFTTSRDGYLGMEVSSARGAGSPSASLQARSQRSRSREKASAAPWMCGAPSTAFLKYSIARKVERPIPHYPRPALADSSVSESRH